MVPLILGKNKQFHVRNRKKTQMDEMDEKGKSVKGYFCTIRLCEQMENLQSNIHIGHLIREQLKADQRSASWLAREIGCTRNHVYKIFNRPSLDADLILKISIVLSFNFFQYYSTEVTAAMKTRMGEE